MQCTEIAEYIPGQFFQRELPCLLHILGVIQEAIDIVVVDGYVAIADKLGLGMHLWKSLDSNKPIVGVAKTRFRSASAIEVLRSSNKVPLYVTAVGMGPNEAAIKVSRMAGLNRIPILLKTVDQLVRNHRAPN